MTDQTNLPVPSEVTAALSGVPAPVQIGALKVFSRLLGGAGAYLAAWMRRPAQGVEDLTDAKSLVTKRLAEAAAAQAASDPELVQATLQTLLPSHLRKHANKERVVEAAAEELGQQAEAGEPPNGTAEVEEDWLNSFERFAEDASSERLQRLWGRVLAGEIKRKGSFSKRTLRFIAELDQDMAQLTEGLANRLIADFIPAGEEYQSGELFTNLLEAQQAGLVEGVGGLGFSKELRFGTQPHLIGHRAFGLLLYGTPGASLSFGVSAALTSTGRQVFSLLPSSNEVGRLQKLAEALPKDGVLSIRLAKIAPEGDQWRYWPLQELWSAQPAEDGRGV